MYKQNISAVQRTICNPGPLDQPISEEEIQSALRRIRNQHATGVDKVPRELLKFSADAIANELTHILNEAEWRSTNPWDPYYVGDSQDVSRRKQLAAAAYRALMSMWCRRLLISKSRRLRLYNAFVLPVLTYNCGTWGFKHNEVESLDAFYYRQLHHLIKVFYPNTISNSIDAANQTQSL